MLPIRRNFRFVNGVELVNDQLESEIDSIVSQWNKNSVFVSVKEYGAKGDGVTDDGAAIANAYSYVVNQGGGTVYIPSGTYVIGSTTISPSSNTNIVGAGQRQTIINWNGAGYWLTDTTTGTIKTCFNIIGMSVNVSVGLGFAHIGDDTQTAFSNNNQHIDYIFRDLLVTGKTGAIVAGSRGMLLTQMIRCKIEDCLFFDFDHGWNFKNFDVGWVKHNRIQRFTTYGINHHNDLTGSNQVSDETTYINNEILEIPGTCTAAMNLSQISNIRFYATYMEPASGASIPIAWNANTIYNALIDGGTISKCTSLFTLADCRNLSIRNIGMQNPAISPAPTSTATFQYSGGTDLSGTGGPFHDPNYGLVKVIDCTYLVSNSFKNIPGVQVMSTGLYGSGASLFNGTLGDVAHLYSGQILDRNGKLGRLKESGLVITPDGTNTYLNGSVPTNVGIVTDANATTGNALKSPTSNLFFNVVYPGDVLPGAYELIVRARTGSSVNNNFFAVNYDGATKENFSGWNTTTSYTIANAKFNFNPANNPSTLSLRLGDGTQDLFIDYIILRPCFNSISSQIYVQPDFLFVGSDTTPGFRIIYASAAPTSGNWSRGDITFNTAPAASGTIGWTCVAGGAPGTWKTWGTISA